MMKQLHMKINRAIGGKSLRSTCMSMLYELNEDLFITETQLERGRWVFEPPEIIIAKGYMMLEPYFNNDRVRYILGSFKLYRKNYLAESRKELSSVRFLNPMLAANAYASTNTGWMKSIFKGSEKFWLDGFEGCNEHIVTKSDTGTVIDRIIWPRTQI